MRNKIIIILVSLLTFISATNSYAADKIITVKGVESSQLQTVVGQPNNVPTLIVYNTSTCSDNFPKLKVFSSLMPQTLEYTSFSELAPVNLATLQSPLGGYRLSGITWFNNEFHGSGYQCRNGKILFLHSKDGKDWYVSSEQQVREITSNYIKAMIGSSKSGNPTLVAIGDDGQVYYQKLNSDDSWHVSDLSLNPNMAFQLISYHHRFLLIATSFPANDNSLPEQPHVYLSADGKTWKSVTTPTGVLVGFFGSVFSLDEDKLFAQALINNIDTIVQLGIDESTNALIIENTMTTPTSPTIGGLNLVNAIYSSKTGAYYFIFSDYDNKQNYWIKTNTGAVTDKLQILSIENNNPYEIISSDDGLNHYLFMLNDKPYFLAGVNFNRGYYEDTAIYHLVS